MGWMSRIRASNRFSEALDLSRGASGVSGASRNSDYLDSGTKRAFDIAFVLLLAPLAGLLVAISAGAVVLSTRENPFFWQKRHGRQARPFWILKLRTMRSASEQGPFRQATRSDDRTTRVGRFLRQTSLDELPQLWNVLLGEMSIVGPRPHPVELDRMFSPLISGYDRRFDAKPGITGLAQVRGARGETATVTSMVRRVRYDQKYIRTASLSLDLFILWATVSAVLFASDAY